MIINYHCFSLGRYVVGPQSIPRLTVAVTLSSRLRLLFANLTCCLHHSPLALLNPYRLALAISDPRRLHALKERDVFQPST